jgi:protease-4
VIIHPAGEMSLTGFSSTSFFARGLLDRLGIYPDLMHIGEFKSASDMLTRSDMSEAQEIATTALLESMQEELTGAVVEGWSLDPAEVSAILEDGIFTSDRAVDRGLADMVGRPSDADDLIGVDTGRRIRTVSLDEYAASIPSGGRWEPEPHVAVVVATGFIVPGRSGEMFPLGRTMGSETLSDQIRRAASVPGVRALVVRIDSGGGDALASDDIHHAMAETSGRIPVIVSMGGVAASGGYYMACAADVVYADAMTVTGSIGIISGKFSFGEMLEKLGVNPVQTSVSPSGGMQSSWRPYTEGERERVFLMMADGYDLFVGTVAESRGMSVQAVDSIGRGRVWSGTDALAIGLVDSIGGVADAISCAARMGGIDDRVPAVRVYPEPSALGSLDPMTGYFGSGFGDTACELFTEGRLLYVAPPMSIE